MRSRRASRLIWSRSNATGPATSARKAGRGRTGRLNYATLTGLALCASAAAGLAPGLTFSAGVAVILGTIVVGVIAGCRAPPMLPVTVGDLMAAAETGVWPLRYEDEAPTRP